ncbi:MAG: hypothetical protein RMM58_11915 [Chloroflexota bacterium]|nr:hypothetical protein [Dehalococcoidia bacterium]MDW8254572.1 hypothetical protein [Chloroflexota bacterium]
MARQALSRAERPLVLPGVLGGVVIILLGTRLGRIGGGGAQPAPAAA